MTNSNESKRNFGSLNTVPEGVVGKDAYNELWPLCVLPWSLGP